MRAARPYLIAAATALVTSLVTGLPPAHANDDFDGRRWQFGLEVKAHGRSSDDFRFVTRFPDPNLLPSERVAQVAADPGDHLEVSVVTLYADGFWREGAIQLHAKVDIIDLYDRNPTSSDDEIDIDELWLRFGREIDPGGVQEGAGAYLKIGKMPKFERQDDRHLESYGLISTAFNRMEDFGVELGARGGRHVYGKLSFSQGNPVFFRDPLALAGDNGTPEIRNRQTPEFGSGIGFPYDAEVENDLDFENPEIGVGLGVRFASQDGNRALDLLAWQYRRDLADTVELEGTFYGGDIDFLLGPRNDFRYDVNDDEKEEFGANLWLYLGGFSLFAQYVDQDLGGLERTGYEAEIAWGFDLPLVWSVGGKQLFPYIAPAARYSKLEPDFAIPFITPAPSFGWEWEKVDFGLRLGIWEDIDLTLEHTLNEFVIGGTGRNVDESLATLRVRI